MQMLGMYFLILIYQVNVLQLDVQVDCDKVKVQGVLLIDLFGMLQIYFGLFYVNDFNQFGCIWCVMVQVDGLYCESVEDIVNLCICNNQGEMVLIGSMVNISIIYGLDLVICYNGYLVVDLIGDVDLWVFFFLQVMMYLEELLKQILLNGMNIEWMDFSFQQVIQGNMVLIVFLVVVLLVFFVLVVLYESWILLLVVIFIVLMMMFFVLFGVWLIGGDNNVFVQVGLVVLMGLVCKNVILIVEFVCELEIQGKGIMEVVLEVCCLCLCLIVMIFIVFIVGIILLIFGYGVGVEVCGVIGIMVFFGMLGVMFFGLFLMLVFYVMLWKLVICRKLVQEDLFVQFVVDNKKIVFII